MSKIYIVTYQKLETYASPYESEWEYETITLCATFNKKFAEDTVEAHNVGKSSYERSYATISEFTVTGPAAE